MSLFLTFQRILKHKPYKTKKQPTLSNENNNENESVQEEPPKIVQFARTTLLAFFKVLG